MPATNASCAPTSSTISLLNTSSLRASGADPDVATPVCVSSESAEPSRLSRWRIHWLCGTDEPGVRVPDGDDDESTPAVNTLDESVC